MNTNRDDAHSNEIAEALRTASVTHKLRVFTACVSLVALAAAVFVAPKFSSLDEVKEFLNARRFLTTESIVDVKTAEPAPEPPKTISTEEPTEKLDLSDPMTEELNLPNNSVLEYVEEPLDFESDGDGSDATFDAPNVDEPQVLPSPAEEPSVDELLESPIPDEAVEEIDAPTPDDAQIDAPAPDDAQIDAPTPDDAQIAPEPPVENPNEARKPKSRVFAQAANILQSPEASSKYFARAAEIVDARDGFSPNSFSDAASAAVAAGRANSSQNAVDRDVAPVNYERAASARDGVASAEYEAPKNAAPNATDERPTPSRSEVGDADAQRRELSPEEAQSVQTSQMELRRQGLLGAHIERWNDRTFRATGMTRSPEGAYFNEAFGATPEEAAQALLNKTQSPDAEGRPIKSGF